MKYNNTIELADFISKTYYSFEGKRIAFNCANSFIFDRLQRLMDDVHKLNTKSIEYVFPASLWFDGRELYTTLILTAYENGSWERKVTIV